MKVEIKITPDLAHLVSMAEKKNLGAELLYLALLDMKENRNSTILASTQVASKDLNIN
tara:strand:+ start:1201 stop:1374 length:174 start_codon:yes stop_codon:yes gene_type:complete